MTSYSIIYVAWLLAKIKYAIISPITMLQG